MSTYSKIIHVFLVFLLLFIGMTLALYYYAYSSSLEALNNSRNFHNLPKIDKINFKRLTIFDLGNTKVFSKEVKIEFIYENRPDYDDGVDFELYPHFSEITLFFPADKKK